MNRFLFFNFKKSKMLYIFLVLIIAIWGCVFSQFIAMRDFKKSFPNIYMGAVPHENGIFFKVNMLHDLAKKDEYIKEIKELLNPKVKMGVYNILVAEQIASIDRKNLNLTSKKKKKKFVVGEDENTIDIIAMNYNYINYLNSEIKVKDLKNDDDIKVAVLGDFYKKDFEIGDIINIEDEKIKVAGFFNKDSYYIDGPGAAVWLRQLDSNIVIFEENLTSLNCFTLISKDKSLDELRKDINAMGAGNIAATFESELQMFMQGEGVVNQKDEILIKIVFMSILNILIIGSIVSYKINSNRETIGVIYSLGGNSKLIFKMIIKELSILIGLGVSISIFLSYKLSEIAILFFINQNRINTVIVGQFILMCILVIIVSISLLNIRKLSNAELIGGFKE